MAIMIAFMLMSVSRGSVRVSVSAVSVNPGKRS